MEEEETPGHLLLHSPVVRTLTQGAGDLGSRSHSARGHLNLSPQLLRKNSAPPGWAWLREPFMASLEADLLGSQVTWPGGEQAGESLAAA